MAIDRRFRDVVNSQVRNAVPIRGPFASPRLVGMVRKAAISWTPAYGFRHVVSGLDEPGYDAAMDAAAGAISAIVGDDLSSFASDLRLEAMRTTTGTGAGTVSATLFALPMHGPLDAMEAFASGDGYASLVESFLSHGVAAPGATVLMARRLVRPEDMVAALPGTIRSLLNAAIADAAAIPRSGLLSQAASVRIACILARRPPHRQPVPRSGLRIPARVALGVRILAGDPEGAVPIDYFGAFMPAAVARGLVSMDDEGAYAPSQAEADGSPEIDAWLAAANAGASAFGITLALPDHWSAATAAVGCMHLQDGLAQALAASGLRDAPIEAVHVHRSGEAVSVGLVAGGRLVGPVTAASCLISSDPGHLDRAMSSYDAPVAFHDEADPFPALQAA